MRFIVAAVRKKSTKMTDEEDDKIFFNISYARFFDLMFGVIVVVAMTTTALLWNNFSTVVNFVGAFCSSYLAYVAPSMFILLARRKYDKGFKWSERRNWFPIFLCGFGCFFMVLGTIAAFM